MEISLSGTLVSFVDEQVAERGLTSPSEYFALLLRRERDRIALRRRMLEGIASPTAGPADLEYFGALRTRSRHPRGE
jgi:hypothetical protein